MTLKRLELSGFKSFAKKTVLEYNTPVTAIVGPNGSGKSNVVEAIRFVLGEQSMKSLRGKAGADLIFKGSKNLSALSRASVTIVFDNTKKIFSFSGEDRPDMSFDEISISREVYSDGKNTYLINGTEVRLKDVVDLLASVHIGSSGHHIISQGEADRILSANSKDRRAMIEDALGLKVYQYKIRESERKLEKTTNNTKEVQSLRREIAPHISFLKKQVEKIQKTQVLRDELGALYHEYFGHAARYMRLEGERVNTLRRTHAEKLRALDVELSQLHQTSGGEQNQMEDAELARLQREHAALRPLFDEFTRKIGRIEGALDALENRKESAAIQAVHREISVALSRIRVVAGDIERIIDEALGSGDMAKVTGALSSVKERMTAFMRDVEEKREEPKPVLPSADTGGEREALTKTKNELLDNIAALQARAAAFENEINARRAAVAGEQQKMREAQRAYYEKKTERAELDARTSVIALEVDALTVFETAYNEATAEAEALVGRHVVDTIAELGHESDTHALRTAVEDLRRKIERIKIKLEDSGAAGGADVLKEHDEAIERDAFLARELDDLVKSANELRMFIRELKDTLDLEFKSGIEKINKQFQEFFSTMFGGGSAFVSVVVEHKRPSKTSEDDEEVEDEDGELEFERGIEINISLPHKKVRDLHMLSGGERSLTSIALLFAMTQVNPPPFLVLDETDAALDEANSRKYGNMIETLSKHTQLAVVTHNRETMSRAQVLYGVTLGADGGSKLLSIKFDEAVAIAK